jgi:hypothetical protein
MITFRCNAFKFNKSSECCDVVYSLIGHNIFWKTNRQHHTDVDNEMMYFKNKQWIMTNDRSEFHD